MLQQRMTEMRIEGSAGSDDLRVTVVINGKHEAMAVHISPSLLEQSMEMLQELTASAITDAAHKLEEQLQREFLSAFGQ